MQLNRLSKRTKHQVRRNRSHQVERLEERRLLAVDNPFAVIDGRIANESNAEFDISLQAGSFSTASGAVRLDFRIDAANPSLDTAPLLLFDSNGVPLTPIVTSDGASGEQSYSSFDLSLDDYSIIASSDSGSGDFQVGISLGGDIDGDRDIDGGDFLAWQRGFGNSTDANDFSSFQVNYGASTSLDILSLDAAVAPPAIDEGGDLYLATTATAELTGATATDATVTLD